MKLSVFPATHSELTETYCQETAGNVLTYCQETAGNVLTYCQETAGNVLSRNQLMCKWYEDASQGGLRNHRCM